MTILVPLTFIEFADAILRQPEDNVVPCLLEAHDWMLRAATREEDYEQLAFGIYRLRWVLAEGGALHQWITLLNRTELKTRLPLAKLRREVTFGWLLLQNDQIDAANYAYDQASDLLERMIVTKNSPKIWPHLYQSWLDIKVGRLLLRADRHATTTDVDEALEVWQHAADAGFPHIDRRLRLAQAAVQLAAGMIGACYETSHTVYDYFERRHMNAEAGAAAFFIARCTALHEGIEPLCEPATGSSQNWLMKAVEHWVERMHMPLGVRLLAPYIDALALEPPPFRPSRLNRHLNPKTSALN